MARKRRKRRINWSPVLWLALLANIAAGLWLSPLTSVRKLKVEGVPTHDRGRIVQLAQSLKSKPVLVVNPMEFESAVQKDSAVAAAEFRRSLFGSASLGVSYRTAVARLESTEGRYLDRTGQIFSTRHPPKNLPAVQLHASALKPSLTLLGSSPSREIAELIQKIPRNLLQKGLVVEVDSEASVCLNIMQGPRIDLGGAERLDEKLGKLKSLLSERPNLLQDVQELNLTEPSRPVLRPRRGIHP